MRRDKGPSTVRLHEQGIRTAQRSGHRKRVTGQVVVDRGGKVHGVTCTVSPDASDKLRGLQIDSLTVTPCVVGADLPRLVIR